MSEPDVVTIGEIPGLFAVVEVRYEGRSDGKTLAVVDLVAA